MVENHKMVVENSGLLTVSALKQLDCEGKKIVCILSGGNMDVITMSSVVQHGLIQRGRIFTVSVQLPDRPGELVRVADVIAKAQGNIIRLEHNQFVSINRNAAVELTITMEAFGNDHKESIIAALKRQGIHRNRNSRLPFTNKGGAVMDQKSLLFTPEGVRDIYGEDCEKEPKFSREFIRL